MEENKILVTQLTDEQRRIYDDVLDDVINKAGGLYFVYGYGGTGKTFLWRALSSALRSKGDIVLNVASSGIASLLLPGGQTALFRFAIPISINEDSTCNINVGSSLTMRDLMHAKNPNSYMTFGGKTVVFGGDFRQILPVIPKGTRQDIVGASINSSYLWRSCKVYRLTKNLRLRCLESNTQVHEIEEFAKWIANIGDGEIGNSTEGYSDLNIPDHLLLRFNDDPIGIIVDSTFPGFLNGNHELSCLKNIAILAPTLDVVDQVNEYMN
ncbi:ATP-dependent DNA helicase PIF4-like [Ipomoea triloba]|uniref:ATP-dependent DNA helicase PIF4-like n=1 Tax=Ipomoea triloba TaxID=35885 RepID=UPI00125E453A|nr:ATP-dependent DNA helicase PIF4-like [Ipomoea triloba]